MSLEINCPLPAEEADISNVSCEVHFGQFVRLAFARLAGDIFTNETTFALETNWDTVLAANDDTKVQFTPLYNNFVIPEGAAATIGPDTNETYFGELKVVGKTAISPIGRFQGLPFGVKTELEEYIDEGATYGNLGIFLIDEFEKVYGIQLGGAGTTVTSIPISSFFIGDPGSEGFNNLTYTPFQFNFKANWTQFLVSVTPDFNPIIKQNP